MRRGEFLARQIDDRPLFAALSIKLNWFLAGENVAELLGLSPSHAHVHVQTGAQRDAQMDAQMNDFLKKAENKGAKMRKRAIF